MIKPAFQMSRGQALEVFRKAQMVHLAGTDEQGQPVLRTLHGVQVGEAIAFHGGAHGEKLALLDRPVVLSAERVVAEVPSYFIDPELACPATTLFVSAQARGTLRKVEDPQRKAEVLTALMQRFQPEGGFAPIDPDDPRYRRAVGSILITEVRPQQVQGKRKLGQHKTAAIMERICEGLFARGQPGDLEAIVEIVAHHPAGLRPDFLRGPAGFSMELQPGANDAADLRALLDGSYWNTQVAPQTVLEAHLGASAWVGARDDSGRLVASARATADGAKHAFIHDVIVHSQLRGRGLGQAVMQLLLRHPKVRGARRRYLITRDAQAFYARFGFEASAPAYTYMTGQIDVA